MLSRSGDEKVCGVSLWGHLWGQALIICFLSGSMEALRFEHQDQSSWQARKLGAGETGGRQGDTGTGRQGDKEQRSGALGRRTAGERGAVETEDGRTRGVRNQHKCGVRNAECGMN